MPSIKKINIVDSILKLELLIGFKTNIKLYHNWLLIYIKSLVYLSLVKQDMKYVTTDQKGGSGSSKNGLFDPIQLHTWFWCFRALLIN